MEIYEVFPTAIASFVFPNFESYASVLRAEVATALKEVADHKGDPDLPNRVRQTTDSLHERLGLAPLVEFIARTTRDYVSLLGDCSEIDLRLQCCWATVAYAGDQLDMHAHSNSHVSGVFYADVDETRAGDILFRDPRVQNRILDLPVRKRTRLNEKYHSIAPKNGLLLLFPAWLEHKVLRNASQKPRVSISFNITMHGNVGHSKFFSAAHL